MIFNMELEREYTAVFKKSGRWFVAWVEEIPGVNTQGRTLKEARSNLQDALALILETNKSATQRERKSVRRENLRILIPA